MSYRTAPRAARVQTPPPPANPTWSPPPGAAYIWLGPSGDLMLGLPQASGESGHTIRVATRDLAACSKFLLHLLSARAIAPRARIVEPGVPTQQLADALASALRAGQKIHHAVLDADKLSPEDFDD